MTSLKPWRLQVHSRWFGGNMQGLIYSRLLNMSDQSQWSQGTDITEQDVTSKHGRHSCSNAGSRLSMIHCIWSTVCEWHDCIYCAAHNKSFTSLADAQWLASFKIRQDTTPQYCQPHPAQMRQSPQTKNGMEFVCSNCMQASLWSLEIPAFKQLRYAYVQVLPCSKCWSAVSFAVCMHVLPVHLLSIQHPQ